MNHSPRAEASVAIVRWLEEAGFQGDLSALAVCLDDVPESAERIVHQLVPSLLKLSHRDRDEAQTIIIDMMIELQHIARHAEEAANVLGIISNFLE